MRHACGEARDKRWLNFQDGVSKYNVYSKSIKLSVQFFSTKSLRNLLYKHVYQTCARLFDAELELTQS